MLWFKEPQSSSEGPLGCCAVAVKERPEVLFPCLFSIRILIIMSLEVSFQKKKKKVYSGNKTWKTLHLDYGERDGQTEALSPHCHPGQTNLIWMNISAYYLGSRHQLWPSALLSSPLCALHPEGCLQYRSDQLTLLFKIVSWPLSAGGGESQFHKMPPEPGSSFVPWSHLGPSRALVFLQVHCLLFLPSEPLNACSLCLHLLIRQVSD